MSLVLPDCPSRAPIRLATLAVDRVVLDAWLREHRRLWDGMDDKVAAAALLGGLCSEVMEAILDRVPGTSGITWPDASDVLLNLTWAAWVDGTSSTPVLTYRVELPPSPAACSAGPAAAIVDLHAPLVEALTGASGLPIRALWRIVTDSVAQACLDVGYRQGDTARGMALAREVLEDRTSPLFNRQWGFFEVEAHRPDGRCVREWFRARGGCCRYYTTAGGTVCSTCVLRDPASRIAILRDWLATRPEAA